MSKASEEADNYASYESNCDGPVEDTFLLIDSMWYASGKKQCKHCGKVRSL